jgi:hypothetical protein
MVGLPTGCRLDDGQRPLNSPWVSSDLLVLLASDLSAAERGLQKRENQIVYTFPPDFIQRLRRALEEYRRERKK